MPRLMVRPPPLIFLRGLCCGLLFFPVAARSEEPVTRRQAMATADAYQRVEWKPSAKNVFHGLDPDGIQVDTPDRDFQLYGNHPGWWKPGETYTGVPYQWGGFSSLEEFVDGVKSGKWAGDTYSHAKRQGLDAVVSKYAVGIDCSGLVSRCWGLSRSYSTRALPGLCDPLASYEDLRPADILALYNEHVMLFKEWKDASHQRMHVFEAGAPPTGKVGVDDISVAYLLRLNYKGYRYRQIKD